MRECLCVWQPHKHGVTERERNGCTEFFALCGWREYCWGRDSRTVCNAELRRDGGAKGRVRASKAGIPGREGITVARVSVAAFARVPGMRLVYKGRE